MSWIDQHPEWRGRLRRHRRNQSVDQKTFREAMSRLGAAVMHHTMGTRQDGFTATGRRLGVRRAADPAGRLTAAPPACRSCAQRRVLPSTRLRAGDELIADTFAGRTKVAPRVRFDAGEWENPVDRSPALMSAVVAFDCRVIPKSRQLRPMPFISAWSRRSTRAAAARRCLSRPPVQRQV